MNSVRCGNCQHHFSEAEPVDFIIIRTMTGLKRTLRNLCVAGASEGVSLPPCAQVSLLVVLVGPHLVPPVLHVLTRCPDSSGLPHLLALKLIRIYLENANVRAVVPTDIATLSVGMIIPRISYALLKD